MVIGDSIVTNHFLKKHKQIAYFFNNRVLLTYQI
jgi:hypothetical protein